MTPGVNAVWDLWAHAFVGDFTNSFTANVPLHSVWALRITNGVRMPLPPAGTNFVSDLGWMADVSNNVTFPGNYPYAKIFRPASLRWPARHEIHQRPRHDHLHADQIFFGRRWELRGFQSDIGVDDIATPFGSVIFRVYGDGTNIYESGALTSTNPVQSIDLSLSNYNFVTLEVSNAIPNTANDYADWGNARITFLPLPPRTPVNVSATLLTNHFAVSWFAVSGATEYVLSRGTVSGGLYTPISTNAGLSYLDAGVVPGTTYFYVITVQPTRTAQSTNLGRIRDVAPGVLDEHPNCYGAELESRHELDQYDRISQSCRGGGGHQPAAISTNQTINLNLPSPSGLLALGAANNSSAITVAANGGTLTFDNDTSPAALTELATAAGDTMSAPLVLNQNLTVTNLSTNFLTLAGPIAGVGSLTHNGPGPLLLSGSNSFAGPVSSMAAS